MSDTDKHLEQFTNKKTRAGEVVGGSVKGYISGKKKDPKDALKTGRLILTDQRVCFYRKGLVGENFESIDLSNITSIESNSMMGHRTVKLYSTHNELTFNSFKSKDEFDPLVTQIENSMGRQESLQPAADIVSISPVEQLEKLAGLLNSGVLTADEFAAKKAEILARI